MMASTIFLSLGSNLGDREHTLRSAVALLAETLRVLSVSSVYGTEPVGIADQPAFLNLALAAETTLPPHELLALVKQIEHTLGRRPTFRWGPRVVDIDILLYDDLRLETPELTIPHREMTRRAFVLMPLAEIAPDILHPTAALTIQQLSDQLDSSEKVRRLN